MARPRKNQPMPGLVRVPADESLPLKHWRAYVEVAAVNAQRRRKQKVSKDWNTAYRHLRDMQNELEQNPAMTSRSITVNMWLDEYLTTIAAKKIRPKTMHTYRGLLDREVRPIIGTVKLDRLAPADIRRVIDNTLKDHSDATARQVHRILVVALKHAVGDGHMIRNVAALVDSPSVADREQDALTVDEALRVIAAAKDAHDRYWTLWSAVLLTGARQGELLGLQHARVGGFLDLSKQLQRLTWEHGCGGECGRIRGSDCPQRTVRHPPGSRVEHLEGGYWLTQPKTGAGTRAIPLVEPLRTILRDHIDGDDEPNPYGLVWHRSDGKPLDPRDESEAWHDALKRAKVPDMRLHDGRHSTVDLLYAAGVPEDVMIEIVGHSSRMTTRGYKSKSQTRKIAAMEQLSRLFMPPETDTPAALEA